MTIFSVINLPAMVKYFVLVFWVVILFSCKEKKPDLKGEEIVEVEDFIGFFSETKLPVKITDSGLSKKQTDSQMIGYKVFTQFIPDTVLQKDFGKTAQPQLYALGRTQDKGRETYLFVQAVHAKKKSGLSGVLRQGPKLSQYVSPCKNRRRKLFVRIWSAG